MASLTDDQKEDFKLTTLDDLQNTVLDIQERKAASKTMRYVARMRPFLEAMDQFGKVVEVFLNASQFLAYIWVTDSHRVGNKFLLMKWMKGPAKFILQVRDIPDVSGTTFDQLCLGRELFHGSFWCTARCLSRDRREYTLIVSIWDVVQPKPIHAKSVRENIYWHSFFPPKSSEVFSWQR